MTVNVRGYAAQSPKDALAPFRFERRDQLTDDVAIEILYKDNVIIETMLKVFLPRRLL